jgi:hypothetical protein
MADWTPDEITLSIRSANQVANGLRLQAVAEELATITGKEPSTAQAAIEAVRALQTGAPSPKPAALLVALYNHFVAHPGDLEYRCRAIRDRLEVLRGALSLAADANPRCTECRGDLGGHSVGRLEKHESWCSRFPL